MYHKLVETFNFVSEGNNTIYSRDVWYMRLPYYTAVVTVSIYIIASLQQLTASKPTIPDRDGTRPN